MILMRLSAAIFAAFFMGAFGAALAQDVTLTSREGAVQVSGDLLSYDGEFYRVDTIFGELTLDGQAVVCTGPGCPDLEAFVAEFTFAGEASMGAVLMPALIEAFANKRNLTTQRVTDSDGRLRLVLSSPETEKDVARVTFRLSTTEEGFADLLAGEADLVMAVREVRVDEATRSQEAGQGDLRDAARSRVVALDAIVPIVSASNPVRAVTPEALADLLSGTTALWPGTENPVQIQAGPPRTGLAQLVEDTLLLPADGGLSNARHHDSDAAVAAAVAANPFALAVTRMSQTGNARILRLVGACGMSPRLDHRTLKAEDYPLPAPLYLYTPARRLPLFAREFLAFLSTPTAQIVVRRAGYVDQTREQIPLSDQGERLDNAIAMAGAEVSLRDLQTMMDDLRGAVRLTTSFRFRGGSTALDAQSSGNVRDLARAMESGAFDGRQLIFVGFSDGEGRAAANRKIAGQRAEAVRQAVRAMAVTADMSRIKLSVRAYGEALPMACDDSEWGRRVNRRVEVWLR